MSRENFHENFKIIVTEEGAKKIFPINIENAEDYLEASIESYRDSISSDLEDVVFTLFKRGNDFYVLIVNPNGKNYRYNCQDKTIIQEE